MTKIARLFLILMLTLAAGGRALAAGLEASLDRTRIVEGETLVLTLSAPGDTWGVPDLAPLAVDFEVANQGQSTRMSIVNGRSSSTREWQLLLAPKRSGSLTIPAIELGNLSSEPLKVEVLPASQAAEVGETLPVMLEVEVDKDAPYVQGQVVYSARVLTRVNVSQGSLSDPVAEGAIIERLGEDKRYETYRNGQRYQVIERGYAIFPQHSGTLTIQAPTLTGEVPDERRDQRGSMFGGALSRDFERFFGRDPFEDMGSLFQRARPIQVRGRDLDLDVRAQPAGASAPWLPAESLQLAEDWSPGLSEVHAGEPVTRTIAITAQGLTDAQLPDLDLPVPAGVKSYPDKSRTETRTDGDDVISVKELKLALVPSAEGEITLPEVRVAWWDTQADQERVAALPARVVSVLPARAGSASTAAHALSPSESAAENSRPEEQVAPSAPADSEVTVSETEPASARLPIPVRFWPWISAGLAVAWLATLSLWLRERRRFPHGGIPSSEAAVIPRGPSLSEARARIKRACGESDPKTARTALLAWAAANWPEDPPTGLEDLRRRLDKSAGETLGELDRRLYAGDGAHWDGAAAWTVLGPALVQASKSHADSGSGESALPPLYPEHV